MLQFGHCPRCGTEITNDRLIGGTVVCSCGWSKSTRSEVNSRRSMDRTCASIVLVGGLLIAAFVHAINWDRHFFAVMPLKARQLVGTASADDYEKLAAICAERRKQECVEKSYVAIARLQPDNLSNLFRLGEHQFKRERYALAIESFSAYFRGKGSDPEAAFLFAQSLSKAKRFAEADRYFRYALGKKKDVLPVTYVRGYVGMLIDAQKLQQAKSTILAYRKRSAQANLFMEHELREVRTRLGEVDTALAKGG